MNKVKLKQLILGFAPIIGLLVLFVSFIMIGNMKGINITYGMQAVINQSVVVAVVATGAVFIYTLGSFDISLGASVAVSALIGAIVYNDTHNLGIMFIACILIAVVIALFNSVMASVFNLPVFVTTIAMLSVLNAFVLLLISINGTGSQIAVPAQAVLGLDNIGFKITVLVLYILLCVFLFNYTPIGRMEKFVGGNPLCAKLTGISDKKMGIIAFAIAGLGVGIGAFLTIIYAPTLTKNTASSIGMDVIIAIVFGGMPVSGGARSKITSAVIGAFSITFLSQIMTLFNLNSGIGQIVKSIIFIVVVYIATSDYRSKMLPR